MKDRDQNAEMELDTATQFWTNGDNLKYWNYTIYNNN